MSIAIGVDPGHSGAVVAIQDFQVIWAKGSETEQDVSRFIRLWGGSGFPTFALIERVHSMPKQGVASSFKFGMSYGFLRGCLISLGIPFEEIAPQRWQRDMGCLTKGDKNVSKARAQQLFPKVKVTHAIADALLIAERCRRLMVERGLA